MATAAERRHRTRVAALGCIACYIQGTPGTPAEIHHSRETAGAGQKSSESDIMGLCPPHHRGTHHPKISSIHLDRNNFIQQFGSEDELLAVVRRLLGIS